MSPTRSAIVAMSGSTTAIRLRTCSSFSSPNPASFAGYAWLASGTRRRRSKTTADGGGRPPSTPGRGWVRNGAVSYLVLARKYRPQSFGDLIGQEHVAQTLANAIAQDRVAHAFLFTGVRG